MNKTLDIGNLNLKHGKEFKLEGNTLTVPFGCTIDQISKFLEKEKQAKLNDEKPQDWDETQDWPDFENI